MDLLHESRLKSRITIDPDSGCWEFNGCNAGGYGQLSIQGVFFYAHRLAYELFIGPIPTGRELDHLCRNRCCCNPEHLEAVTHQQNMARSPVIGGRPGNQNARKHPKTAIAAN